MKKLLKPISLVIGVLSIIGMSYNLWAYARLKAILTPNQLALPSIVDTYTIGIGLAFIFICIFHLMLLFHTVYFLPRMQKNFFIGALFFCGLVLSGLYIASDVALLNDLGNEYLLWDVSMEWRMLFITSSLQLALMAVGFTILIKNKESFPFALFPKSPKLDESMFIIVTQVGLICALLGILMLPMPYIMGVKDRYRDMYLITLTILALLPFASSILYWLIRNRGKKLTEILDEKQFQDVSFGGLLAVLLLILVIIAGLILSRIGTIDLNNVTYSLITIDIAVLIISSTVLIRSKN